ncbi:MAG: DUF6273 domain-containing protein [Treponema sp.]|nr:DUF6273 domain-containing protein [Treponema sp.]
MKKIIIGLFTALLLVGMAGCKNGVESGGGSGSGGGGSNTSTPYTKVDTQTIGGTTYDIVTFGSFPQSEKASTVSISSESKIVGSFTYYKGDDDEWYAKVGSKYYKVEPIKWRVLTVNYNGTGKKLLLAENILINCMYYNYYNVNRTISAATIYPNNYEHSRIRAYLNGLSYQKKAGDSANQEPDEAFVNKGFFQTAFTQAEQDAIAATTVINNARSTNPDSNDKQWNNGANQYASDTPTSDKIFLLSEQEATKADYGFAAYNEYKGDGTHNDSTRIRMTTDFAKANGAYQETTEGSGGYWWLRSPDCNHSNYARYVSYNGNALKNRDVNLGNIGVVPALCLK